MIKDFNIFNQAEIPPVVLCNTNMEKLNSIENIMYDTKVNLKYNAVSTFAFKIPKKININNEDINFYTLLKPKKLIFVETIGYFVISQVKETTDGSIPVLEIECNSIESEIIYKRIATLTASSIPLKSKFGIASISNTGIFLKTGHSLVNNQEVILTTTGALPVPFIASNGYYVVNSNVENGTFQLSNSIGGNPIIEITSSGSGIHSANCGILDKLLLQYIQNWSFSKDDKGLDVDIPSDVIFDADGKTIYRSFDVTDTTVYYFLINEIEKAYNCIVVFDKENRSFHVESANVSSSTIKDTNIFLSYDNLIKSSNFTELSDEIVTSLLCYGDNSLDIGRVNPIGGNIIYNFEYYKTTKWMSAELINRINEWNRKIEIESSGVTSDVDANNSIYIDNLKLACLNYSKYNFAKIKRGEEISKQESLLKAITGTRETEYYTANINYLTNGSGNLPNIPSKYKLSSIYQWNIYGSLNAIGDPGRFLSVITSAINSMKNNITNYNTKITKLANAYIEYAHYLSIQTIRKNQYTAEETLMKTALDLDGNNANEINDHKINMEFLLNGNPTDSIPNTSDSKNKLILLTLTDTEFFILGGINNITAIINSISPVDITSTTSTENTYSFITQIMNILKEINAELDLKTNMGEYYTYLLPFVIQNTYQNSNITITNIMSEGEKINQALSLYNQSKDILKKVSEPRYEFSIELTNFLTLIEYKNTFTSELDLGSKVRIDIKDTPIISVLLEIDFSFDNPQDLKLTFSNRLRLDNQQFQYFDLLGESSKLGSSVTYGKISWNNWTEYNKIDVTKFITSSLNAATNSVINSSNEEITINQSGIRGRKKLDDSGYSNEEIWVTNNQISFTQDAWDTASTFIGKTNNQEQYGIVAEKIFGTLIAGTTLNITSSGKDALNNPIFQIQADKVKLTNMNLKVRKTNTNNSTTQIEINNSSGIIIGKIDTSTGTYINKDFYFDTSGNLILPSVTTSVGAWNIDKKGLSYGENNYIYSEELSLGDGAIVVTNKSIRLGRAGGIYISVTGGAEIVGNATIARLVGRTINVTGEVKAVNNFTTSESPGEDKLGKSGTIEVVDTEMTGTYILTYKGGIITGFELKT